MITPILEFAFVLILGGVSAALWRYETARDEAETELAEADDDDDDDDDI